MPEAMKVARALGSLGSVFESHSYDNPEVLEVTMPAMPSPYRCASSLRGTMSFESMERDKGRKMIFANFSRSIGECVRHELSPVTAHIPRVKP